MARPSALEPDYIQVLENKFIHAALDGIEMPYIFIYVYIFIFIYAKSS